MHHEPLHRRLPAGPLLLALPFLTLLGLGIATPAIAKPVVESEHWYVVKLQGKRAGHMSMVITRDKEKKLIATKSDISLAMARAGQTITIKMASTFTETFDHKPVSAQGQQLMGQMSLQNTMVFTEDGIELISTQNKRNTRRSIPKLKGDWLTPTAVTKQFEANLKKGSKTFSFATVDALVGPRIVTTKSEVVGEKVIEVFGKSVLAIEIRQTQSIQPHQVVTVFVNKQGDMLKMTTPLLPGVNMVMLQADKELAMSKVEPSEMLVQTFVKVANPIKGPRDLRRGVFEMTVDRKELTDEVLAQQRKAITDAGYQRVRWKSDTQAVITVDLRDPVGEPSKDGPGKAYTESSSFITSADEEVVKLTQRALSKGRGKNAKDLTEAQKAERLRAFVYRYIQKKNLGVAFATAGEVARTRQGDCTEHAVLLAAMLRAADIPSRVVTGLIYADAFAGSRELFGYHMWTQAWLPAKDGKGGRWVDLDAVLPKHAFDATHIALGHSSLSEEDGMVSMSQTAALINRIAIKVIEPK